ncbi:MAG: hypothetical protein KY449_07770, partial [Proteobacteria bacterium]|nr:hypothetical protein [Pseudomonadota bacterium]
GDFFALASGKSGFDPTQPNRRHDAILLDIDHSPGALLNSDHGAFYTRQGLGRLRRRLRPDGVFAMWSDAAPEDASLQDMRAVFQAVQSPVIEFDNPSRAARRVARSTSDEPPGTVIRPRTEPRLDGVLRRRSTMAMASDEGPHQPRRPRQAWLDASGLPGQAQGAIRFVERALAR